MIKQNLVVFDDIVDRYDLEQYTKYCPSCQRTLLISCFSGHDATCTLCTYSRKYGPVKFGGPMYLRLMKLSAFNQMRESENGNVEVQCQYNKCNIWFEPSWVMLYSRGKTIDSDGNRLYCSNECKEECDIFGKHPIICRSCKTPFLAPSAFSRYCENCSPLDRDREVQPELRDMVFKRDNYTCIKCGATDELQCHHIEGIRYNPIESADIDLCVTVCIPCHNEIHSEEGCRYIDLQCKKE
jgi:hypothetical protein